MSNASLLKRRAVVCAACVVASGLIVEQASAQNQAVWDGGSSGSSQGWYTAANWVGDTLPNAGDTLVFATRNGTDPNRVIGTSALTNISTGSLFISLSTFDFFAQKPFLSSLVFGNDTVSQLPPTLNVFNGGGSGAPNQTMTLVGDSSGNYISLKSSVNSLVRIRRVNNGTLTLALQGAGAFNVVNPAGTLELEANVTGTTGLVKTGAGTLYVNTSSTTAGFQTFTGGVDVREGLLRVALSSGLGPTSNTVTIRDAGALQYESTGTVPAAREHVVAGANSAFLYNGTGLTIGGLISGTGTLNKTGTGVLSLGGTNAFTGGIKVQQGSLYINSPITSTADISVAGPATLGGNSTYDTANIRLGGLLDPGPSGVVGTFTTTGNVVLTDGTSAGVLRTGFTVTGQHDNLAVGGNLDLTGGSALFSGLASANDAVIPIITYGTLTGTFAGFSNSLVGGYTVDYNYNGTNTIALLRGNTKLYFTGAASTDFNVATNFTTDAAGTLPTTQTPTASADVTFNGVGNTGNYNAVIGSGTTYVNSLTFSSLAPVTISQAVSGSGTLVTRGAGINLAAGTGLVVTPGAGAVTINAPLAPNTNQTYFNNSASTLTLAGPVSLGSSLTLALSGTGTTVVSGVISGSGALTATGAGTVQLTGLNTYTGGTIVNKSGNGTLQVNSNAEPAILSSALGVDIQNGGLVFNYSDPFIVDIVKGQLASSFTSGGGVMNTGMIRSSTASLTRGLGYRDSGGSLLVKAALFGDADLDGGVSINDFNALAGNFGQSTGKVWVDGDFDYDGGVSINDFNLLAGGFGQSLPPTSEVWAGLLAFAAAHNDLVAFEAVTGVPEPTSLGLVAAGMTLGLRRRRRA